MSGDNIEMSDVPEYLKNIPHRERGVKIIKDVEKAHILKVCSSRYNKTRAAEILQIDRKTHTEKIEN
jgi:transcriptional regulator with PAS, ATPase and Fis domain